MIVDFKDDDNESAQERIKTIGLLTSESMVKIIDSDEPRSTITPPQSSMRTRLYRVASRLREPDWFSVGDMLEVFDAHGLEVVEKATRP